jgi:hypothetical protein
MRYETIEAWRQLYAAVGLLAAICPGCALLETVHDIRTGIIALPASEGLRWLPWFPKVWLHFQIAYLCGFPSILVILILYAHYIGFSAFIPANGKAQRRDIQ